VTAASVAVAVAACLPDQVLPPGFDRLGDVIRFEQLAVGASGEPEVELAMPTPGAPCEAKSAALRPGTFGLPGTAAPRLRNGAGEFNSKSTRALKDEDLVPCSRCGLRGHVAGDPVRCLYYRGSFGLGGQASIGAEHPSTWSGRPTTG
jgi:hypothetical protein